MKYGEKIVPTRVPRTNGLDLDKNSRRLSRSFLIKGAGINGGNFPTNPRSIDPFSHPNFFPARFSISVLSGKFRLIRNTEGIGPRRHRRYFICPAIATLSAVAVARALHPNHARTRVGLNFLRLREE